MQNDKAGKSSAQRTFPASKEDAKTFWKNLGPGSYELRYYPRTKKLVLTRRYSSEVASSECEDFEPLKIAQLLGFPEVHEYVENLWTMHVPCAIVFTNKRDDMDCQAICEALEHAHVPFTVEVQPLRQAIALELDGESLMVGVLRVTLESLKEHIAACARQHAHAIAHFASL